MPSPQFGGQFGGSLGFSGSLGPATHADELPHFDFTPWTKSSNSPPFQPDMSWIDIRVASLGSLVRIRDWFGFCSFSVPIEIRLAICAISLIVASSSRDSTEALAGAAASCRSTRSMV